MRIHWVYVIPQGLPSSFASLRRTKMVIPTTLPFANTGLRAALVILTAPPFANTKDPVRHYYRVTFCFHQLSKASF